MPQLQVREKAHVLNFTCELTVLPEEGATAPFPQIFKSSALLTAERPGTSVSRESVLSTGPD